MWRFWAAFRAFVDYRRRVFCAKLLQKPLGMLTHLWLCSLIASFCWQSFPWIAISIRPSSSALLCQLALSLSSLGPSFPPLLQVSWEISSSGPLFGFRAKTYKEIVWVAPTQTETNCYASCHSFEISILVFSCHSVVYIDINHNSNTNTYTNTGGLCCFRYERVY